MSKIYENKIKNNKPKKNSKFHQGYIPNSMCTKLFRSAKNEPIIYRSGLEYQFICFCENNPKIKQWASEPISIKYNCRLDNKEHEQYKLDTRNMKINVLEKFLETNKFDKIKNSYSYIIDYVTTRHETFEEYQRIMNTYNTKVDELLKYIQTPINVIWLNELNNLETELKKYYSDMNYELE